MSTNHDVFLPAQKVFLFYPYPREELHYITWLSTGLACGTNFYQAATSALYEVIERDSFMLTWHLQIPGVRIEVDHISNKDLKILYGHICKYLTGEDKLYIYDISKTDGIYTIMTFIRNNQPNAYGLIVSAASHPSPEIALLKALEELCQTQRFAYTNLCKEDGEKHQHMTAQDVDSLHKHFFYYSTGRHSHNIDFISTSSQQTRLSDMEDYSKGSDEDNLKSLMFKLQSNGMSAYIADITKPEIKASGFKVLKAIIPDYVDLEVNHNFRQLNNSRLKKYQNKYKSTINDNPHPFP